MWRTTKTLLHFQGNKACKSFQSNSLQTKVVVSQGKAVLRNDSVILSPAKLAGKQVHILLTPFSSKCDQMYITTFSDNLCRTDNFRRDTDNFRRDTDNFRMPYRNFTTPQLTTTFYNISDFYGILQHFTNKLSLNVGFYCW